MAIALSLRITILAGKSSLIAAWYGSGVILAHDVYNSCPASKKLKGLGPRSFRKGSIVISSINKPDHYIVSLLHVFEDTLVYDSAPTAHRRLTLEFPALPLDEISELYRKISCESHDLVTTVSKVLL